VFELYGDGHLEWRSGVARRLQPSGRRSPKGFALHELQKR
jgi:hypothetical protein